MRGGVSKTTPVTAPKSSSRTTLVLGSLPVRTGVRGGRVSEGSGRGGGQGE